MSPAEAPYPYERIRRHLEDRIASGHYAIGQKLPSETELMRLFGVSRMTVNRAMKELEAAGLIERVPGSGSYVADRRAQGHLLAIHDIAAELARRGHRHHAQILERETLAGEILADAGFPPDTRVHRVRIRHFRDNEPVLVEERWVDLAVAPAYEEADLTAETSYQVLMRLAPLQKAEHVVRAVAADRELAAQLALVPGAPILLVHRRTWARERLCSVADLWHAGERYELVGRLS